MSLAVALLHFVAIAGCSRGSGGGAAGGGGAGGGGGDDPNVITREITEYHAPQQKPDDALVDDRLEQKRNTFASDLVDRRPLGEWSINQSEAVVRLDVPIVRPDFEGDLLTIFPSYAAAVSGVKGKSHAADGVLPSVNMIDGKAKQFDDGLYAALDQAYYRGLDERLHSHVELVKRIQDKVGPDGPAAAFLAAGLKLVRQDVPVRDTAGRDAWIQRFESNHVRSKPIAFYTWNDTLKDCWRFLRFFQTNLAGRDLAIAANILQAFESDDSILADYKKATDFYAKLTNPYASLSLVDIIGVATLDNERVRELCKERDIEPAALAVFPPSTSRETVLFEKLFGFGLPENVDLMRELIRRIRSGEVNLAPTESSGWYEYQVYALETLLLPEKGEEHNKLLLTKAYKERMLEAFKALITKRRETHARQLKTAEAPMSMERPPEKPLEVKPRLRVEPCPSYFLRTARAYAFLENFLEAAVGQESLASLHGLHKNGERSETLGDELRFMRELFYGLYLIAAEDIGMKTAIKEGEVESESQCYDVAMEWLKQAFEDPDLAVDTRVAIPIMVDFDRNVTRLWVTLGVRMTKLDSRFATPPRIKPKEGDGDWQQVEHRTLATSNYLIPVDEFAEVEVRGSVALTREELRAICDRAKTKEAIIEALRGP
jgi:hypothetical protein